MLAKLNPRRRWEGECDRGDGVSWPGALRGTRLRDGAGPDTLWRGEGGSGGIWGAGEWRKGWQGGEIFAGWVQNREQKIRLKAFGFNSTTSTSNKTIIKHNNIK